MDWVEYAKIFFLTIMKSMKEDVGNKKVQPETDD